MWVTFLIHRAPDRRCWSAVDTNISETLVHRSYLNPCSKRKESVTYS